MDHPFAGILPGDIAQPDLSGRGGRRHFLRRTLGVVAGAVAILFGSSRESSAQIYTTQALGEEGGWGYRGRPYHYGQSPSPYNYPRQRWYYYGRARPRGRYYHPWWGGYYQPGYPRGGRYTTQAIGEEGGYYGGWR